MQLKNNELPIIMKYEGKIVEDIYQICLSLKGTAKVSDIEDAVKHINNTTTPQPDSAPTKLVTTIKNSIKRHFLLFLK